MQETKQICAKQTKQGRPRIAVNRTNEEAQRESTKAKSKRRPEREGGGLTKPMHKALIEKAYNMH